jgi:uncharacterized protein with GYD domain
MPLYMHQWSYKGEQVKQLLLEKADRAEVVRVAIEAFGGTLQSFFYCFGKYDGIAISEFPDSESALASVLAISAQGRINFVHTTALFSPEEGLKAMRNAGEVIGSRQPPATP